MHISQCCTWSLMFHCHQFPPLLHTIVCFGVRYVLTFREFTSRHSMYMYKVFPSYGVNLWPGYQNKRQPVQYSTVTHYKLDGPGIEYQCGKYFPCMSKPATRTTQPPVQRVLGFSGCKADGEWCWPPTPSSATGANGLEIHLHLTSVPT